MADINLNNLDGIPFGNNAGRPANPVVGQPYFNGEASRLELYTSNGWQNITQETPSVVSITGQGRQSTTSTITINGTNFASGANVFVVGTDGIEVPANSVTLVSAVQITAVLPALSIAYEPYDVKVVNPSNLYGILYETLNVDATPAWTTGSGSLGTYIEQSAMSIQVSATDASDASSSALIYSISSGALPPGLSISSSTGVISGTPANVSSETTYNFTANAYDGQNNVTRNFSITITDRAPIWVTAATLPTFTRNVAYSTTLSSTTDDVAAIAYSLFSGSLPTGLTLSSNGVISGTPTVVTDATFTIRATEPDSGNFADRQFTLNNLGPNSPTWTTSGTISSMSNGSAYSYQLVATDDSGTAPTYSIVSGTLPTGITLSSSGLISGTTSAITGSTGTISMVFSATDANGLVTNSSTISIPTVLYAFSSHTFTNAGASGRNGPSLSTVRSAYSSTSWASTYLNMSTTGIQEWSIPSGGTYRITCAGAKGGDSRNGSAAGSGATMIGTFVLTAGTILNIVVGQRGVSNTNGGDYNGGAGGGGSFVYTGSIGGGGLLIASGGGGGGFAGANSLVSTLAQAHAKSETSGQTITDGGGFTSSGGTGGNGGVTSNRDGASINSGGSGSGWLTDGLYFNNVSTTPQLSGRRFIGGLSNSGAGAIDGGFGGGGAAGNIPSGPNGGGNSWAGGGGGYSGGGSGSNGGQGDGQYGGGAGSYNSGTNQSNSGGSNTGNGYVTIEKLS